jgi:hypothetical protein
MAMNYDTFVSTIANIGALDPTTTEFIQIMPQVISYAEDRIYRELDLLDTIFVNATKALQPGTRDFALPQIQEGSYASNYLTVTGINLIYGGNQRQVLQPVALTYLNYVWGSSTGAALPEYFAMVKQDNIVVGPWPDQAYQVEVFGTYQPQPMSSSNQITLLTTYVPDLLVAAAMVMLSGYMRDFGAQSDNPQQAMSWEQTYQNLFKSAQMLELRKKQCGPGWTALSSIPVVPVR